MVNRKRVSAVYLLLTIYASSVVPVHAAFEDTGTGARAAALGGAYAAVGTDSYSLMYNPAGLAPVRSTEVGTEYSRLFSGLSDNSNLTQVYLGFAQPLKNEQAIGVGIKQFSLQDLYKERVIALGYAKTISPGWSVGTVVKQLYHSVRDEGVSVDDNGNITSGSGSFFSQNGTSKSAYSFDLGMRYVPTDRHVVAVSMQDINEPNIALSESDHDIVPR